MAAPRYTRFAPRHHRFLITPTLAVALALTWTAGPSIHAAAAPVQMSGVTFRLQVHGHPQTSATFWVAYGPLNGDWGMVRLHDSGSGLYSATSLMPPGRTIFAYLVGEGRVTTPHGTYPGGAITTIRRFGPISAADAGRRTVQWHVPVG